jgi:hypothetical protein
MVNPRELVEVVGDKRMVMVVCRWRRKYTKPNNVLPLFFFKGISYPREK